MKQRTIVLSLLLTLIVGVGLVVLLMFLNGEPHGISRKFQETANAVYTTNTWVFERIAETMTATYSAME